jgi:FSR family fosmidomycin resistance protein-like MFS transporter
MIDTLVQDGQVALAWPVMLPGLATAGIVALLAPRVHRGRQGAASLRETLERHGRVLGALVLVTGLRAWASAAIVTFIPLLATSRGASLDEGATTLTAYLLAGAAGGLAGGYVSDRLGRDVTIVISLLLSVPFGLYLALVNSTGPDFVLAAAISGFMLNGGFVVTTVRAQESVPGSVGMVTGLLLGLSIGLGGVAVTPLALMAEHIGLPAATALAASTAGLAAAAMALVPRD